jgi:hypothetical protein
MRSIDVTSMCERPSIIELVWHGFRATPHNSGLRIIHIMRNSALCGTRNTGTRQRRSPRGTSNRCVQTRNTSAVFADRMDSRSRWLD